MFSSVMRDCKVFSPNVTALATRYVSASELPRAVVINVSRTASPSPPLISAIISSSFSSSISRPAIDVSRDSKRFSNFNNWKSISTIFSLILISEVNKGLFSSLPMKVIRDVLINSKRSLRFSSISTSRVVRESSIALRTSSFVRLYFSVKYA